MKQTGKILIVDDDQDILIAGKLLLKRHFTEVLTCHLPGNIPELLNNHQFDAILLDMNFGPGESSGEQGYYWLKQILEIQPKAVVIMITAHGGVNVAVEAMKLGATDFVGKPWQNEKMVATVSTAVLLGRSRNETEQLKSTNKVLTQVNNTQHSQPILGASNAMQAVHSLIEKAAPTDANILILGENGTGKELAARAIHQASQRRDQVFMSVDLGAISETLFESELFGHKKGAFTGANEERVGRLIAANGGTLFLDEIGNIPLHLQAKLLTILEQRQVTRLGENKPQPFNVRVLAATNMPQSQLNDEAKFRQDLLFRLNTVEIKLPPLRERQEDIIDITKHYVSMYSKKYQKADKPLSSQAVSALKSDSWLGNVRALRHAVERAVILSEGDVLKASDFQLSHAESPSTPKPDNNTAAPIESTMASRTGEDSIDELNLEKLEKQAITQSLRKHKYNISHAAKELGLTRAALYRRMEKHGL